jgi:hypothetical protein
MTPLGLLLFVVALDPPFLAVVEDHQGEDEEVAVSAVPIAPGDMAAAVGHFVRT